MIYVKIHQSFYIICFIIQISSIYLDDLPRKTFHCNGEKYISDAQVCNGRADCKDGSDEYKGCNKYNFCGDSKRICADKPCNNTEIHCNTIKDCEDGSDEMNCGDEVKVEGCSIYDGNFLCHDGLRCLGMEYTCDGICNCFDCSDENSDCLKYDFDEHEKCPHAYFATANGPQCLCDSNDREFDLLCKKIIDCTGTKETNCEQRCSKLRNETICSCFENYLPVPGSNRTKCRTDTWYENLLLYSTDLRIKLRNITSKEVSIIDDEINCTALSAAHEYAYYASSMKGKGVIFKTSIKSGEQEAILMQPNTTYSSIAVDYITNNIYFTTNKSLSVCTNDGNICGLLKCGYITYVAIAPKSGLMFYFEKNNAVERGGLIMKSSMDGSNETIFEESYYDVIVLVVDESVNELYVVKKGSVYGSDEVFRIGFDGKQNNTLNEFFYRFLSLTIIDNTMYYSRNGSSYFWSINVRNKLREALIDWDTSSIIYKQLYAYNPLKQRNHENPCAQARCSGICLLRPSSLNSNLNYTCICNNFNSTNGSMWCNKCPTRQHSSSSWLVLVLLLVLIVMLSLVGYFAFRNKHLLCD